MTTTPTCTDCGTHLPSHDGAGRQKELCDICNSIRKAKRAKEYYHTHNVAAKRKKAAENAKAAPKPPPPVVETVEIRDDEALRKLAVAVVLTAVREAKARKPDAALWLVSPEAELFYDALEIHPHSVSQWMRNGMRTDRVRV